ncbi:Gldg family protein [Sphingobacterium detergens]
MKLICKIAQNEIRNLFYSPVAWFLGIAFWVLCALTFTDSLVQMVNIQEVSLQNNPAFEGFLWASLTNIILIKGSLFSVVISNLYFFLPLLTMGLISRELNNGTIKLLYSSPVKPIHIVLGKYLAIVFYCVCLLGILSIFLVISLFTIMHVDGGIVLSALLALFLLICTYAAIGIFMSCLSTYQIVSGVATFLLIFALSAVGQLWQEYDFVRELTYFLSIGGRTERMLKGLITTSDIIYFLSIITMFVSFTYFKVKGATTSRPWAKALSQYALVVVIVLTVGYISSRPACIAYWDVTRNDVNTIHPKVQDILHKFDKGSPLKVTLYVNLLDNSIGRGGTPDQRKSYEMNLWEGYVRFKPDIQFDYVYYYDVMPGDSSLYKQYPNKSLKQIAEIVGKIIRVNPDRFISPAEIRKRIDLTAENKRVVMHLEYKDKETFLRTYDDGMFWPDQMNTAAAFKRLLQEDLPKVLFTSGNLERSIYKTGEREYNYLSRDIGNRQALINMGFDSDTIDLDHQDIPKGIAALVVADPKTSLSTLKQDKIRKYVNNGGPAMFVGEPGKQDLLNPLLNDLGVQFSPGTLVEVTKNETPDMVRPMITKEGFSLSDQYRIERDRLRIGKPVAQGSIAMPGMVAVSVTGKTDFKPLQILTTDPQRKAYNTIDKLIVDSVPPVFTPSRGDTQKASYTAMLGLSRKKGDSEQRILVAGDGDFLSKLRQGAGMFSVAMFSWLDNNRLPVYVVPPEPIDIFFTISNTTAQTIRAVSLYLMPALLLLTGIVILIRRKRK